MILQLLKPEIWDSIFISFSQLHIQFTSKKL